MNDRIGDLRVPRHQLVLHHVRELMRLGEPHVGGQPDVQVEEHVVGGAARPDLMAADDAGHAHDDALDVGVGDDDPVAENRGGRARDLIARVRDEAGDDQRGHRIENRQPGARADERRDDRQRRPHVAACLRGVRQQHFAFELRRGARFVADDDQIDDDRHDHHGEACGGDRGRRRSSGQVIERDPQHLDDDEQ